MYGEAGARFEHDPSVIAFAYLLVKEYDEHNLRENQKFYNKNPDLQEFEVGEKPIKKRGYVK